MVTQFLIMPYNVEEELGMSTKKIAADISPITISKKSFFKTTRSPYYIYGLDYRYSSAGVRILHYLCHALNEIGEEAYIFCNINNPHLRTPLLTQEVKDIHIKTKRIPIAIYPEVVPGNPFKAPIVARYIMNTPGHLGGDTCYDKEELLFCYMPYFVPKDMKADLLCVPATDISIFNNENNIYDHVRQGVYYYALKYLLNGGKLTSEVKGAVDLAQLANINALTPHQLASILRRAELLYCYEPSAIVVEANLCGCPVAYIPTHYLKENPNKAMLGEDGAAFGTDIEAISTAKSTVSCVRDRYLKLIDEAWHQLDRFIEITQSAASRLQVIDIKPANETSLVNSDGIITDLSYVNWRDHHRWSIFAVARLAEQVTPSIEFGAGVHLLMVAAADENVALADTIDTLAAQGSAGWRLTVFSPDPCPNPLFETELTLAWVQITAAEELPSALKQAVALSPVDWFMVCAPGIRLEPPFVSLVLATSVQHPDWRCVYFDEERVNSDGQMTDPRLKPDANIELLRSSAYIGHAVLTHRALWSALNLHLAAMPRAFAFDAGLRAIESGGTAALGHIDELAVALPETADGTSEVWAHIAKPLLEGHLQRSGLIASVNDGYLPATFFVDYALTDSPLISIIIPVKDRLDLLQPCVESLLEKTDYSIYEVIIVDNNSTDSVTLDYLDHLPDRDERIKVLRYTQNYNYSAINNSAARHAKGEFLLLLDNDTLILQESWLDRLVAIAVHPEVGAVGCRLVSPDQWIEHAGLILGHGGTVDHIGKKLPLTEPGYMGRTQLTQNFSAVSGDCMLVRKELFFEVGGFDQKDFSSLYCDADFCLKVGERGYQIVWTPFVTLAQQSNQDSSAENTKDKNSVSVHKAFIKKWGSRLGNDPAYNRHLSLRQHGWMIDGDFDTPWHPDLEPLPRIIAQPPDEMGVGQYRVLGPIKELTNSGQICSFILPALSSEKRFLPYSSELIRAKPTTLFLQNAFSDFQLDDLQNYAELLPDIFRVFGQDDIVFAVPQKSAAHKHFGKGTKARVRRAISYCHRVIVTNEIMAEALRDMVADIHVVPNYLERSHWGDLKPLRIERRKPRVGWAGAQQHGGDLEFILPVVEATANEVDWIFMGMCPPKLRYHVAEVHNAVPFDQYPATLATLDLDLAIAPLEINRFNAAKSNLRLLEYGAVGYPVICTDIQPYQNAPVTRVPNNPKAWIEAIREHIHDLDATHVAGDQLQTWVLSHWMLDQHLDEWLRALLPG
jgi:GT2 family glycosyltransferase